LFLRVLAVLAADSPSEIIVAGLLTLSFVLKLEIMQSQRLDYCAGCTPRRTNADWLHVDRIGSLLPVAQQQASPSFRGAFSRNHWG
jgi:hypothetical protein